MGVDVRLVVYAENKAKAERACAAAFETFATLDTIMSDYRDQSELNLLCANAGGPAVKVSHQLYVVLERSQELARQTSGAFDVTCSPIIRLWRAARKSRVLPTVEQLATARSVTGYKMLTLDPQDESVEFERYGMQLDLGAIGKGYADDEAQKTLRRYGIKSALVEAGGDIVVSDSPPGENGWKIRSEIKATDLPGTNAADPKLMYLHNCAISTSGDTVQFVDIGGTRYSHIIDPRTGMALTTRLEVLIIARNGLTSDGLSTAVSVVGAQKGRELVSHYRGAKMWVGND